MGAERIRNRERQRKMRLRRRARRNWVSSQFQNQSPSKIDSFDTQTNGVHLLIAAPVKYVSSIYEAMLFLSFFLSFLFSRAGVLCGFRKALLFTLFFLVFDWTLHLFFFFLFFFGGGTSSLFRLCFFSSFLKSSTSALVDFYPKIKELSRFCLIHLS